MKPRVKDHYHAHRLSFWLNLIPTLHRSAASETTARHHLLEDHDNPLTYDGIYRQRAKGDWVPVPTTTPPFLPATSPMALGPNSSESILLGGTLEGATVASPSNITDSLAMIMQQGAYSTALSVTIAIGCSLLILNVLIFAGVYYQRDKNKTESMQKREFQIRNDVSCNNPSQSKQPHLMSTVGSPIDLGPPSFMTIPALTEAGTLPSKIPPQEPPGSGMPEAQPLLASTGRPTPPHQWAPTQDMRVHLREKREETTV